MAGKIFISYRREDDQGFAHLLHRDLERVCPADDLFMDVMGHIQPGDDFRTVLTRKVAECDVLLAVIGPRWAEIMVKRAGDPNDYVIFEIAAALEQGKQVIPLLVGGATMPQADVLPEPIRALPTRQMVELRPAHFQTDLQRLLQALRPYLEAGQRERTEEERRRQEAEERWGEVRKKLGVVAALVAFVGLVHGLPIILWTTLGSWWGLACFLVELIGALWLLNDASVEEDITQSLGMIFGVSISFLGFTTGRMELLFAGVTVTLVISFISSRSEFIAVSTPSGRFSTMGTIFMLCSFLVGLLGILIGSTGFIVGGVVAGAPFAAIILLLKYYYHIQYD